MTDNKLTKRQAQVLEFVQKQTAVNGYPPSIREIGEALGLSSSATVHAHLATLEAKGYLHRDGTKSRSLTVSKPRGKASAVNEYPRGIVKLPLVGRVAAGSPILAEENIEETLMLPTEIVGDTSTFLLKVCGESMIGIGINDGDYVVVKEQSTADNGDIVVALMGEEATVKRYFKEKDYIRLQPENEAMEPIYTDDVSIVGKVVALFRTLR